MVDTISPAVCTAPRRMSFGEMEVLITLEEMEARGGTRR
jgi:hypothetical protein